MAHIAYGRARRGRPTGLSVLPLVGFALAGSLAIAYVGYVLWPRWPAEPPVTLDAPALPITVSGVAFNIEPAAIRMPVQRKPGAHERVDLAYLWPSLTPPDPAVKPSVGAPLDPNERLFVTIAGGEATLPPGERLKTIYPRYLTPAIENGPGGLMLRHFSDGSPYQGEDLIYDAAVPERFVARCTRKGVGNSGVCLDERRIDGADVTFRFPRDWLADTATLTSGIERLMARLHPAAR
ncbi:MAG TPA: hypothetical protein VFB45_21130 [Pseudolabrys sp.]|nr:hypothetical protein [Pseudolabrys sp.]